MGDPVGSCISQASFKRYDMVNIEINVSVVTCHGDYINLGILVLLICRLCFYWLFFALKNQRMIDSIVTCHDDYINLGILVLLICRLCFYWLFFVLQNQRMINICRPTQIIPLTQCT